MYSTRGQDLFSAESVLEAARSPRQRPATAIGGGHQKVQDLHVKQQLHNQTVRLREAFLRQDGRITGTVPKFMLASCLRAGGLELSAQQTTEACWRFMTGDGRFNWILFCEHIEKARGKSWSQASRIKSAKAFQDIDRDGSGRLSRDELELALKKWKVPVSDDKLSDLIAKCDSDGDGNISYPEFVDGLARDMVAPTSIWGAVTSARNTSTPRGLSGSGRF
jgi:Ca2+-binding EF-hand superfamily protein